MARRMAVEDVSGLLSLRSSGWPSAEKDMKRKMSDDGVRDKKVKRATKDKSPGSGSSGAKRARTDGKPEAAGGSGSPGASDTVMTGPVVSTIMAIMGTATSMGKSSATLVAKTWERPQVWDDFFPEKKKFVQGMIDLCGAEYSNTKSAGAQYDIIQQSEVDLESSRPPSSVAIPSPSTPESNIMEQLGFNIRRLGDNTPRIPKITPPPQEDDEVLIIKEVTADVPPRAALIIKEEGQEDGEIICTGAEPAILLPHLGGQDLLIPDNSPDPSQEGPHDLNVYQAANNKMDSNSLVWDDWENANNMHLLRIGILMSSRNDAVRPSIWTLTEHGVPPYQECEEGFVHIPFLSYAHSVTPALDPSKHLFAHRLWFCHYVKPPLVFACDPTAPEEVYNCRTMIKEYVKAKPYSMPWGQSLRIFLNDLRNLERRCKLAMETLFRTRGGCNREDYILFVGWVDYTLVSVMEEHMIQCKLPCAEFDPQIAYPMRQDYIAKLALHHIDACVKGERFTGLEKKMEMRELMNSRVFSVMLLNERKAVENAHIILNDATMAGSNLSMEERMAEVVRARQTVMPMLKHFYGKVSIRLTAEMSNMLDDNPETVNDGVATRRISTPLDT